MVDTKAMLNLLIMGVGRDYLHIPIIRSFFIEQENAVVFSDVYLYNIHRVYTRG
ncbi:hypothetical protein Desku_0090 [Desulfofundulus kuznetsovii DSM 6115]|uniref:Uncharacterized protein n=1 Tax=Desulfofundulus kuznetsovii (strain DSM 6115 / VKM B-1805 / 17) TaxID=760568 RepID=A0AAU8PZW5_DESK7|nr:hypothetical protein Desku_0090 [Desulfofundulus kuznetsovii DSM 6115]